MTRDEILSEIKKAENDAKTLVAAANEAKNRKMAEAGAQAREIIRNAEEDARKYGESEIGAARKKIKEERENIIETGKEEASLVKKKAKNNVAKATNHILTEFERTVDA